MDRLEPARHPAEVVAATEAPESLWEIDGESGRFHIELHDPKDNGESDPTVGGMGQRHDGDRPPSDDGARRGVVNWVTEWRLELDPRHPRHLEAELDPGLELIDVQGPAVRGYRIERPGPARG